MDLLKSYKHKLFWETLLEHKKVITRTGVHLMAMSTACFVGPAFAKCIKNRFKNIQTSFNWFSVIMEWVVCLLDMIHTVRSWPRNASVMLWCTATASALSPPPGRLLVWVWFLEHLVARVHPKYYRCMIIKHGIMSSMISTFLVEGQLMLCMKMVDSEWQKSWALPVLNTS